MGSMERQLRRRQQQTAASAPDAGAVDLGQFKGGDRQAQQEVATRMLQQGGWMCSCGERFASEAVAVVGYNLGRFPVQVMTPEGPRLGMDDGAQMLQSAFHSRMCPDYLDAVRNGLKWPEGTPPGNARPKVMAVRSLPPTEWLDDPQAPEAPMASDLLIRP